MGEKRHECDYYMGENVSQGLAEAKYYINQLVPKEEQGDYHKEIFNAIDEAIKIIENKQHCEQAT